MHPRRKYNNVALEAKDRGQASVGAAAGEDGHGAMETSARPRRAEEGDKNQQRALLAKEPDGSDTEARAPPNGCTRLTRAAAEGGKGEGDPPPSSTHPQLAAGALGVPQIQQHRTFLSDGAQELEGDPQP